MRISIIAALATNNVIGDGSRMPWHLSADLQRFKAITTGKPIIMGRKTYKSIGKPLPNRRNIVISRDKNLKIPGCEVYNSLEDALHAVKNSAEVMIIGGAEIYKQALQMAQKMYLTLIHQDFEGNVYFPKWNKEEWQEIERENFPADEKNPYAYSFVVLERKK